MSDICDRCATVLDTKRDRFRVAPGPSRRSDADPWPDRCRFCLRRCHETGCLHVRATPICDACLDHALAVLRHHPDRALTPAAHAR